MSGEVVKISYESGFVDLRKGKGWAAVLRKTMSGEIVREFIDINKIWGKGGFIFTFEREFPVGTVLEISEGGSWKNRYRDYYIVSTEGLKCLGRVDSINAKKKLMEALNVKTLRWAWNNDSNANGSDDRPVPKSTPSDGDPRIKSLVENV
jgi:hypothetical protein